jgi:hypothetical protein
MALLRKLPDHLDNAAFRRRVPEPERRFRAIVSLRIRAPGACRGVGCGADGQLKMVDVAAAEARTLVRHWEGFV